MMVISDKCVFMVAKFEGFRAKPYLCPAGKPTVGYGNTYYLDGRKVKLTDPAINKEGALVLLRFTLANFAEQVKKVVTKELTQNQFDAIVSFVYNIGIGAFKKSTILKLINANPNDPNIAAQFKRWNKGGGKVLNGLVKRRAEESALYFTK